VKIKNVNSSTLRKCLQDSLPVDMMVRFAKEANPGYDIYRRAGISEGIPISKQNAAQRILADMINDGHFIDYVEVLIRAEKKGFMGRHYQFRGLDEVIKGLIKEGYSFDNISGQFFENQRERISSNWGRLLDGDERKMTILRLDIAGNSALVKTNPKAQIEKAYGELRSIVTKAVTSRIGRLWSWDGDGALAVFHFGSMEKMAIYAGIEILHELFFYNRLDNPLDKPVNVRIGVHIGQTVYHNNELERQKNESVKQATIYERLAENNSLCVSYNCYITMDQITLKMYSGEKADRAYKYKLYRIGTEK
jgi:hypothetical protein